MNKPAWVIDTYILENYPEIAKKLPQVIRDEGMEVFETKYKPFAEAIEQDPIPFDPIERPVILYGTHGYIRRIKGPYVVYGTDTFRTRCSVYMNEIPRDWLLNADYLMLPYGEVKRRDKNALFGMFGGGNRLFLRPDSGFKTFAGFVLTYNDMDHQLHGTMKTSSVTDDTICLLAPTQDLLGEFRFVIGKGQVLAGSEYRWDQKLDIRSDYPPECRDLAQQVAELPWQLDSVYICDVALTDDGPKVVELNSFSCAGLYACDHRAVVRGVSDIAAAEFAELFS